MEDKKENKLGKIVLEATVYDIKHHNSKIDDNSYVDLNIRVAGEGNVEAAMLMHRAKNKIVKIEFETNDN